MAGVESLVLKIGENITPYPNDPCTSYICDVSIIAFSRGEKNSLQQKLTIIVFGADQRSDACGGGNLCLHRAVRRWKTSLPGSRPLLQRLQ